VKSVAIHEITGALLKDLKELEFDIKPKGLFGVGMSMKVKGRPHPIRYYQEKQLETEVVCDRCTLCYAIYGVFAFCPDCGVHNSLQILNKNLELAEKEITLAETVERDLANYLIADALENAVSAFDGFGREACKVHAAAASDPAKAENLSFQNLISARQRVQELFGFDLAAGVEPQEWDFACRCFQKRHLLAHKMGVVDEAYLVVAKDPHAVAGRKIVIRPDEVAALTNILRKLGSYFFERVLARLHSRPANGESTP
jgi:hypothetical protein